MENKTIVTLIFGAIFMLAPFAIDMYLPALPTIANQLNTGIDQLEGTVAILLFGYAIGQLIFGPLSDRLGRVSIMRIGLTVFVIASFLAGFVTTIEQLYIARLFQALGGAAATVVVFPLIRARNNEEEGAKVISYVMAITVIAPLIAPIIGSYILTNTNWSWIFYVISGFALIVTMITIYWIKPETTEASRAEAFNLKTVFIAFGVVLKNKTIMLHMLTGGFAFSGLFAFVAGSPFVYITYYGVDPQNYGYLVGLNAIAMIGVNIINAKLLHKVNPTTKLIIGSIALAVIGVALLMINFLDLGLVWLVIGIVTYIGALGLTATNAIVGALSVLPEQNGTVSALNGAIQFGFGAISSFGISIFTSTDASLLVYAMLASAILAFLSGLKLNTIKIGKTHA